VVSIEVPKEERIMRRKGKQERKVRTMTRGAGRDWRKIDVEDISFRAS
jgi:hypothetical protein